MRTETLSRKTAFGFRPNAALSIFTHPAYRHEWVNVFALDPTIGKETFLDGLRREGVMVSELRGFYEGAEEDSFATPRYLPTRKAQTLVEGATMGQESILSLSPVLPGMTETREARLLYHDRYTVLGPWVRLNKHLASVDGFDPFEKLNGWTLDIATGEYWTAG